MGRPELRLDGRLHLVQDPHAQDGDALQLGAQRVELLVALGDHGLLVVELRLGCRQLDLPRLKLRMQDPQLLLRGVDLPLKRLEELAAGQAPYVREQDQHEEDERQGRHDVGERGPYLARALVVRQKVPSIAHGSSLNARRRT